MFKTNTLFILGAGASFPYGYPLGKDLITQILKDMEDDIFIPMYKKDTSSPFWNESDLKHDTLYEFSRIESELLQIEKSLDSMQQDDFINKAKSTYFIKFNKSISKIANHFFHTQIKRIDIFNKLNNVLRTFDPISIDAFLRDNPSYAKAGKTMIIYSLLKRENKNKFEINKSLRTDEKDDNWYSLLLNDIVSECADKPNALLDNNIRFITFNYDLSLDHYLQSRLKNIELFSQVAPKSPTTLADEFLNNLLIRHVYGHLYDLDSSAYGQYADINPGENSLRHVGPPTKNSIQSFKRFIFSLCNYKNIKTMYDERQNSANLKQEIKDHKSDLIWAKDIIFIGFGFDRDNLNILGIPDELRSTQRILDNKTIKYLNYKGEMNSLFQEFKTLGNNIGSFKPVSTIQIVQSNADSISRAYQNDFKKYLFN